MGESVRTASVLVDYLCYYIFHANKEWVPCSICWSSNILNSREKKEERKEERKKEKEKLKLPISFFPLIVLWHANDFKIIICLYSKWLLQGTSPNL